MRTFDTIPPAALGAARNAGHYAAQLVAAAGVTLLEPDVHFHYSSMVFDPATASLVGAVLPGHRRVRLHLQSLTLSVIQVDGHEVSMGLLGQTPEQAATWLSSVLDCALTFPDWDMPAGPILTQGAFAAHSNELTALAHWFSASHHLISAFDPGQGSRSDVRVWPHHFDIAMLTTLETNAEDPEQSRSVGLGMTPGDGGIDQPYFYVTPWPYPDVRATPPLPVGRWNVAGWYGAVLEADALESRGGIEGFVRAAFDYAAATVEP